MIHSPNYLNGKIYKMTCELTNKIYIGSTTQNLKYRLSHHKTKHNSTMSKSFINPKIELIEDFPCNSKNELHLKEAEYIRNLNCVNRSIPLRTQKEWIEDNKEYCQIRQQNYYKKNKHIIKKESFQY